jgi:hypothetical protein
VDKWAATAVEQHNLNDCARFFGCYMGIPSKLRYPGVYACYLDDKTSTKHCTFTQTWGTIV